MNLYDTGRQGAGDDWDNGIISEAASLGPMPIPAWLVTHRELHTSRRIRLISSALTESSGEQQLRPSVVA